MSVVDRLGGSDEQPRLGRLGIGVEEHGALLKHGTEVFDGEVDDGVQQRVTWGEQLRLWAAWSANLAAIEAHPFVPVQDEVATSARACMAHTFGDTRDLVAPGLAPGDSAAETLEGGMEERPQVVRLKPASLCQLKLPGDLRRVRERQRLDVEGSLGQQLLDPVADGGINHLFQPGAHVRPVAVTDRLQQQLAQGLVLERLTQDVEHLPAEVSALPLHLGEQPAEDVTLAGPGGVQVPQVAGLGLSDAMYASEPLLDSIRVPRQVVVDHQVRPLQVQALARCVGRDQDPHVPVLGEPLGRVPA
ncbi:hypothetical protein AB1046_00710 [Promicromonospora sp. Populi]|uniref:hypothetical protein n=1 Tax=Promicromonospora sp. Populi TaxID=3239420 RepID=UPI0034E302F8